MVDSSKSPKLFCEFSLLATIGTGCEKINDAIGGGHSSFNLDNFSKQAVAALTEGIAREQIEKYEKSKSSIVAFREQFGAFVEKIANGSGDGETKPLVLIIDELDSCRLIYATEILEKAKHFFNVYGHVFVLAVDKGHPEKPTSRCPRCKILQREGNALCKGCALILDVFRRSSREPTFRVGDLITDISFNNSGLLTSGSSHRSWSSGLSITGIRS